MKGTQVRILDKLSRLATADSANDSNALDDFNREVAQGRVLLEVRIDAQNQPAVERLIAMLGTDSRRFAIGERDTRPEPALDD